MSRCQIRDYHKSPTQYATGCLEVVEGKIDYLLYIHSRRNLHPTEIPIIEGAKRTLFHNATVACRLLDLRKEAER